MELMDLLEQRVSLLLAEVGNLRHENAQLKQKVAERNSKLDEINELQEQLMQEKQIRDQSLARIESLLQRIQGGLDNA